MLLPVPLPPENHLQVDGHVQLALGGGGLGLLVHYGTPRCRADLPDGNQPPVKVHAVPGEPQDLLPPQPQQRGQLDQHLNPVPPAQLQQGLELLRGVKTDVGLLVPGRIHLLGRVAEQHALTHRGFQGGVEEVVVLPDRVGVELPVPHQGGIVARLSRIRVA